MTEGVNNILNKSITEKEAWEIIKPVCRELYDLVNDGNIQFVSGSHNEVNGTYKINLKDSIGDIEYNQGNIRIGLRSNGIPTNLFVQLI